MAIFSFEEALRKTGTKASDVKSMGVPSTPLSSSKQGFISDAVSDLDQVGTDIRSSFNRRMDNNLISSQANQGVGSKTLQELGSGFGFAGDVAGSVIKGVTKAVLPQGGEDAVKNTISSVATPIVNSRPVQSLMERYNALAPEVKRNLDSTLNIGSLLTEAFGVGAGTKVARTGVEVGLRGLREGGEKVAQGASRVANTVKDSTSGIVDFVRPTIDAVRNAPSNIKTNIEASKVYQESVNKLPQTAQNAVKKGVDIEDLTKTLSVDKAQKPALGKLYTGVKDFVSGKSKLNPIEAVGKPVVTRFNILKNQIKGLGTQLDEVAEGLKGKVVKGRQSVVDTVDETLAKIGISKTDEGLDFVGSNLEGLGADEKIIGNIYRRIQESTDANDLHRLKKYIDNNVNFGKTSGGFTGEAESLIKGWRKTIDGRLDLEFPDYNKVNTELAKRLKPINDFKKHMKSATGLDEDLMNMSAGQLMRRIASNVRSNPEIRQVLRDLDNATKVKGKVSGNIEALVDFYATLEKYYPEIVGKNTLQGQFKNALETSGGIVDKVTGAVKSVAGQSEAVKRKAITDFFDDFFNTGSFNKGAVPTTAPSVKVTPKKPFDRTRQGGFTANPFAQKPIKITPEIKDFVSSELSIYDGTPLTINGKIDMSGAENSFRLDQLKEINNKRVLNSEETAEAFDLLQMEGIKPDKTLFQTAVKGKKK